MSKVFTDIRSLRNPLGEWKSPFDQRYGTDFNDYKKSKQYYGYKYATWTTAAGKVAVLIEDSKQNELAITLVDKEVEFPAGVEESVRFACALCGVVIP